MILVWLIVIPLAGGLVAGLVAGRSQASCRVVALAATILGFLLSVMLWVRNYAHVSLWQQRNWLAEFDRPWIAGFGIHFHLAMDGMSLLLIVLTFLLGIASVLVSWREIDDGVGFFHFNLLWVLAGIVGVFLAVDLFLFYFAWELMLVPMYFLIAIWGHEHRVYAAVKFFLFTQLSGLLMLVAILTLYFAHHAATGVYTFDYAELIGTPLSPRVGLLVMLGFFVAFAVKLPMFPFHTWLPDAHTEAPTAGSVVLAGLLLKTGAYGMLRFVLPLFSEAAHRFAPVAAALAIVGILYGAIMAYGQTDLKRLVAYTSVSHLGFVLLGIFIGNRWALEGAFLTMIAHGLSTGMLFMLVGMLQERTHTREMDRLNGLWQTIPRLSGAGLFFVLASIGLPGLGDFVGEFLVLLGSYRSSVWLAALATVGVLCSTFYGLKFVQRAFHGSNVNRWSLADLSGREAAIVGAMVVLVLWLGLYPQPVLNSFEPTVQHLEQVVGPPSMAALSTGARTIPVILSPSRSAGAKDPANGSAAVLGTSPGALQRYGGKR
ncbi:MAG TPA: NADH-quinone oxidoreductase subunit M [Candidatus Acidoferrales bacterium]|nr:NADH-quinone oxidoreductase subunit M [Candidatus Acidoferrales bacterium]